MCTKDPLGLAQHFTLKLLSIVFFFFVFICHCQFLGVLYQQCLEWHVLCLFTSLFHISSVFIYGLHCTHTHTLTLSDSHSLAPSFSPIGLFFFFQNLHPHHDPPRKDGRSSEYLEQEQRYYKSYSSSSLLYHLFFWLVFTQFCFFFLKQVGTSSSAGWNWKNFFMEINIKLMVYIYFLIFFSFLLLIFFILLYFFFV